MTEPFGALGASHLIQVAITAYYDARPSRRTARTAAQDPAAVYPEIYLFHVGGGHGDHSSFDFWPARKEVAVHRDARAVLDAINDRAITRLAVPDAVPIEVEHEWKEPAAARDRIVTAFAYDPSGRVREPEWQITGLVPATEANIKLVLDPARRYSGAAAYGEEVEITDPELVRRSWPVRTGERRSEAADGLALAQERRRSIRNERGLATETYRSVPVDDALLMLV